MALTEYKRKRRFGSTPEPAGGAKPPRGNSFVVQEHHATRLHYDFRLEVDGVMKSWAVPKGPSMNPGDKRLAIQTEDHPVEYAKFEGAIPAGNYGAGQVIIWDNGTFDVEGALPASKQIERGEIKFILYGKKLTGSFVLVKIRPRQPGKSEWLLIKHRDPSASNDWKIDEHGGSVIPTTRGPQKTWISNRPASGKNKSSTLKLPEGAERAAMPGWIPPALASLADRPFSDSDWLFEIKWDGVRTLACVQGDKVRLWSRSRREMTSEYPELSRLAENVNAQNAWLDGEIVALDKEGRSDFQLLQQRFSIIKPTEDLLKQVPVVYYVFDILYYDGHDLRQVPLLERKSFLAKVLKPDALVRYSDHQLEQGKELYEVAVERHLEGILGKQIHSAYPEGRTTNWLKFKLSKELDAVVGGWTEPRGTREHFGALLLGLYDGKKLEFVSGVGSGFSVPVQERLMPQLQALQTSKCPFATTPDTREKAYWTKPKLVARVKYTGWTEGRHLRQPTFLGLQEDHNPADCTFAQEDPKAGNETMRAAKSKVKAGKNAKRAPEPKESRESIAAPAPLHATLKTDAQISEELNKGSREEVFVELDGITLRLTHLNKVYFPGDGYTKRNLLAYYFYAAPLLLPFLKDRPLVLRRYPNGIEGEAFFQKDAGKVPPAWMETAAIKSEDKGKTIRYFVANNRASLLYLANLGCIDHNPWSSRRDDLEHPDYIFFDLDPTDGTPFESVTKLAKMLAEKLEEIGLKIFLKTSGASGLHIFLPVERLYTYEQARNFVHTIASLVAQEHPGLITFERSVRKRSRGSILIDAHQNSEGQSLASVYSVRAFPSASISTPVKAAELNSKLRPEKWNLSSIRKRVSDVGDLWGAFWKSRQKLEAAVQRLERSLKSK